MKKSILYSSLVALFGLYISGCSETMPNGNGAESEKPIAYIVKDDSNNRISGYDNLVTPLVVHAGLEPSHVRGARVYDDFMMEYPAVTPPGANPLAALAGGALGGNEWLCSSCHGYDYEGVTTFNGGAEVNLQDLVPVRGRDEEFVINMLATGFMLSDGTLAHNYSFLDPQAIVDVADFVVNEIYDTHEVLSAATGVGLGDMGEGMAMWTDPGTPAGNGVPLFIRADGTGFACGLCHDGVTASDGATLKATMQADPFKFLHRSNFGLPRDVATFGFGYGDLTVMPGLYEVVLTDGLHFGGPEQAGAIMHYMTATF